MKERKEKKRRKEERGQTGRGLTGLLVALEMNWEGNLNLSQSRGEAQHADLTDHTPLTTHPCHRIH